MSTQTPAEQDAMMQRWKLRHDLRQAYQDVVDMLVVWCIDDVDIPAFRAAGHAGHFGGLQPVDDLIRRLKVNGFSIDEIKTAIKSDEVAADWMTPEEVSSFLKQTTAMDEYFATHDPGPFAEALYIYKLLGQRARLRFFQQYGYYPEASPIPRVKIQGKDSELPKLKPTDHQPSLFGQEDHQ